MSLLFRKAETRSLSYQDVWGTGGSPDLRGDSPKNALTVAAVYAATGLIADQIAAAPWAVYEKSADVPKRAAQQPKLVTDPGMHGLDLFSWKHQMVASVLLTGNAYGFIANVDSRGVPSDVLWWNPSDVYIDDVTGEYYWQGRTVPQGQVIHVPGYVLPGSKRGLSPVGQFRMQIETGLQAQRFGKTFFKRGTVPSGVLQNTAKTLTPTEAQVIKERFNASVSASEPFVAGSDWDYKAIQVPAGDAQFLAGVKSTANQVAAIYRVDPEDVGGETGGSTLKYASLEMNQLKFAVRTLRPWASRVETILSRYLTANNQYIKFNLDAGVRADLKTRYEAHQIAITAGFKTVDEVRQLEELPPLAEEDRTAGAQARAVAELVQKIYLGVGTVITSDEARAIANRAGAGLSGSMESQGS